ncbi:hypothetical protein NN561_009175 [Cricetulus griseus]
MALTLFGECGPRLPAAGGLRPGVACGARGRGAGRPPSRGSCYAAPRAAPIVSSQAGPMGVSSGASPGVVVKGMVPPRAANLRGKLASCLQTNFSQVVK